MMKSIFGKKYEDKPSKKKKKNNHNQGRKQIIITEKPKLGVLNHTRYTIELPKSAVIVIRDQNNSNDVESSSSSENEMHYFQKKQDERHSIPSMAITPRAHEVSNTKRSCCTPEHRFYTAAILIILVVALLFGTGIFLMIYLIPERGSSPSPSPPVPSPTPSPILSCTIIPGFGTGDGIRISNNFSPSQISPLVGSLVTPCVENNSHDPIFINSCNPFTLLYQNYERCENCFQVCSGDAVKLTIVYPKNTYCSPTSFQLQAKGGYATELFKYGRNCYNSYSFESCLAVFYARSDSFCVY